MGDHDSAMVYNGRFTMTVAYKGPSRYMFYSKYELKAKGGYSPFGILVTRPGEINIQANMQSFSNSMVQGAPENERYLKFMNEGGPAWLAIQEQLAARFGNDVLKNLNKANPRYEEILKFYNGLNEANNKLEAERLRTFIEHNKESFASVYLLNNIAASLPAEKLQQLYRLLGKAYLQTSYAQNIAKLLDAMKITAIGKIAPEFEQTDIAGKMVKLSDFRGRYVLLDFWASWCIPCREENPNVVSAWQRFSNKGFTVLGVSLDQPGGKKAWLDAIHTDKLRWAQVSDLKFWNNAVAKLYGIQSIPQNFLLDREGKIIASNIKGKELQQKLLELLGP